MIAIDASRANLDQKTGTEYYSAELLKSLAKIDHDSPYHLYVQGKGWVTEKEWPTNFKVQIIESPFLWTQFRLALEISRVKPEILFVPAHVMPWIHPKKTLITIHDVGYEHYPQSYSKFALWYLKRTTKNMVKKAEQIIVPSESTKKDLVSMYGCDGKKVNVIYHGYNSDLYRKIDNETKIGLTKKKYGLDENENYLFFVGRLEERKNILGMIKAFYKVKSQTNFDYKFVIAGKPGVGYEKIQKLVKDLMIENDVKFLGYVQEEDLPFLLSGADIFLFPTFYEGFGLPILEAMSCGVPVITSKTSSCPEVAGEAAILVNPDNTQEIAEGIVRILSDSRLRNTLVQQGFRQIEKFNWDKTARKTLKVLQKM
ncbi:glycosyltransferase family 4 protein [Patescibacteria group bacterium]